MISCISHDIKKRDNPNDRFYTPLSLVKIHLDYVKEFVNENDIIYEPFFGTGNYFKEFENVFPSNIYEFT